MDVIEKKLRERGGSLGLFCKKHLYNIFPFCVFYCWADVLGMTSDSRFHRYEISLWSFGVSYLSSVHSHPPLHPQRLFVGEGLLETEPWCSVSTAQHQPRHCCVINTLLGTNTKEEYCECWSLSFWLAWNLHGSLQKVSLYLHL